MASFLSTLIPRFLFLAFVLAVLALTAGAAPSLYSAAADINGALGKPGAPLLVDVRDAAEFSASRIHSSINVPLFELKTKTFLAKNDLVLIGRGDDSSSLEKECNRLRSKGWRISILQGGVTRWKSEGLPLEVNPLAFPPTPRTPVRLDTGSPSRTQQTSHTGNQSSGCPTCR